MSRTTIVHSTYAPIGFITAVLYPFSLPRDRRLRAWTGIMGVFSTITAAHPFQEMTCNHEVASSPLYVPLHLRSRVLFPRARRPRIRPRTKARRMQVKHLARRNPLRFAIPTLAVASRAPDLSTSPMRRTSPSIRMKAATGSSAPLTESASSLSPKAPPHPMALHPASRLSSSLSPAPMWSQPA